MNGHEISIGIVIGLAAGSIIGWIANKTITAIRDDLEAPQVDVYTDASGNIKDVSCADRVHLRFRDQREVIDRWRDNRVVKPIDVKGRVW